MKKINKKGGDKIISVYWFAILFIVAAAVVYMVSSFYGTPYDVRELEANALANKVADCFSEAGYIRDNWREINEDNFLTLCGLNFDVEDVHNWNDDQHYIEVRVNNFESNEAFPEITQGNANLKLSCGSEGKNLPVCIQRTFYTIDLDGNQYEIQILSAVRKTEKNA